MRNCKIYEPFVTCNSIAQDLSIIQKSIRQYFFLFRFSLPLICFRCGKISLISNLRQPDRSVAFEMAIGSTGIMLKFMISSSATERCKKKRHIIFLLQFVFFSSSSAPAPFCAQKFNCVRCERSSVLAFSE